MRNSRRKAGTGADVADEPTNGAAIHAAVQSSRPRRPISKLAGALHGEEVPSPSKVRTFHQARRRDARAAPA
jgi:hypothetical protein